MSRGSTAGASRPSRGDDARAACGRVLTALGAGFAAGVVFGGVGGRLAMFVLGRQSPGAGGVASDEGFEIGRFTLLGSLGLALVTGIAGVMFAVLYSAARPALPSRARIPAATLVGGTLGGSSFLDPDGIDLLILDPLWFAVAAFIALPAAAACAIAVALERAARARPWPEAWRVSPSRGLAVTAQVAVTGFVALLIAAQGTKLIDVIGRIP